MTSARERLFYIDQLKGIAILLVVIGHLIQFNFVDFEHNKAFNVIYAFHMPFFMFLSGYVANKTISPSILLNYSGFLKKKTIAILVPFLSWQLLVLPFFFQNNLDENPISKFWTLFTHMHLGLWFLLFLFVYTILYSLFLLLSESLNKKQIVIIDFIILVAILAVLLGLRRVSIFKHIDSIILHFMFYVFGVTISRFAVFRKLITGNIVFTTALLSFLFLAGSYEFGAKSSINLLIKIVVSIAACITLYNIVLRVKWNPAIDEHVREWGRESLIVYVTHFIMLAVSPSSRAVTFSTIPMVLILTIGAIIIIRICIGIARVVESNYWIAFLMFGKRKPSS